MKIRFAVFLAFVGLAFSVPAQASILQAAKTYREPRGDEIRELAKTISLVRKYWPTARETLSLQNLLVKGRIYIVTEWKDGFRQRSETTVPWILGGKRKIFLDQYLVRSDAQIWTRVNPAHKPITPSKQRFFDNERMETRLKLAMALVHEAEHTLHDFPEIKVTSRSKMEDYANQSELGWITYFRKQNPKGSLEREVADRLVKALLSAMEDLREERRSRE